MERPYFLEPSLPFKVREYLKERKGERVDLEDLTEHLIANNREFRSKKKKIFIKSVAKAYNWEMQKITCGSSDNDGGKVSDDEDPEIFLEVPVHQSRDQQAFSIDAMYKPSPSRAFRANTLPERRNVNGFDKLPVSESLNIQNSKNKRKRTSPPVQEIIDITDGAKKIKKKKFETFVPDARFSDLEGVKSILIDARLLGLNSDEQYLKDEHWVHKSTLFIGPEGSGKTMLASALAGEFKFNLLRISARKFMINSSQNSDSGSELIESVFKEALTTLPCLLHIEDLHLLPRETVVNKNVDQITEHLITKIKDVNQNHREKQIVVIGEIRYHYSQNMNISLMSAFEKELFIPALDTSARFCLIKRLCSVLTEKDLKDIANRTTSYVAGDLVKLVRVAEEIAFRRRNASLLLQTSDMKQWIMKGSVQGQDFEEAIKKVTPTLKREGFPFVPEVTMDDIGGMEDVRKEIEDRILRPLKHSDTCRKIGRNTENGILLYGPPGCGKTLLAKAIANEVGLNFLPVNSGEMLKMYQGESERAIREVFRLAASVTPCIIFFDEFDSIAAKRIAGAESGSRQSIVNTLLIEMDGIINREGVYIMASTNRPDVIDPGVLRPGRIETKLYMGLPNATGREKILKAVTKNGKFPRLADEVDLTAVATRAENFSGADLKHLINVATEREFNRAVAAKEEGQEYDDICGITQEDFEYALEKICPSILPADLKYYQKMKAKFEYGKTVALMKERPESLKYDEDILESNA